jgi:hypothetical protein
VRTVLAVTLVYYLAYGPLEPALPLYSRDILHAGPSGYGLLWSAFGAGALSGLATVPIVSRLRPGLALAGNALLWGTTLLPLLLITNTIQPCSSWPWAAWSGRPTSPWRHPCSNAWPQPPCWAGCSGPAGP